MSKFARCSAFILAVGIVARLNSPVASAATLYWDPKGTHGAGGGPGAWDTTSSFWSTVATGGSVNTTWVDGSDAVFGGTGTTQATATATAVSVAAAKTVGNFSFTSLGYTITTATGAALTITNGITANVSTERAINTITGSGGVVMNGTQTISVTNGLNISTVLSGSGTITKTGTGMLGLSGTNTYTGKFVVTVGTLGVASDAALGALPGTAQADAITINGGLLLAGGVSSGPGNYNNPGSFALNANRGITIGASGGTIQVGYGVDISMTVNGVVSGTGAFTKSDSGNLILTANNTYTGTTTITGGALILTGTNATTAAYAVTGTLQIGNGGTTGSIGSGAVTLGTGTGNFLTFNRSNAFTFTNNFNTGGRANVSVLAGQTATMNAVITGTGEFWKQGAGTLILLPAAGSSRATSTVIREGKLQIADVSRTASSPLGTGGLYIGNSSLLTVSAGLSYTGPTASTDVLQNVQTPNAYIEVTDPNTTLTLSNRIVSNTRAGGVDDSVLNKTGAGTLNLGGSDDNNIRVKVTEGTMLLGKNSTSGIHAVANSGGALTYALVQNGGTVRITGTGNDQIYDPSTVQMNGGSFDFFGRSEAFDILLSNTANGIITNTLSGSASVLTLGGNNGSSTFQGRIQDGAGTFALVKTGTGSLALSGTNTMTGGTTLNAGRLIVTGSLTGSMTTVNGGTLGGTGTVGDVSTAGTASIVSPGATTAGAAIGKLTTGNLDLSQLGTFEVAINTSTLESSLAEIQGNLSLGFSAALLSLKEVGSATGDPVGTKFTIMSYTGDWDFGTFLFASLGSIEDGDTFDYGLNTFQIDYDAVGSMPDTNAVTLTVVASVPEPATGGLLLGGLALLGGWRRRTRSAQARA